MPSLELGLEPPARAALELRLVLCLAAVYLIWGSTYLVMRIAVFDLPPLLMASVRFASAGLVLLVIARRRGAAWPGARDWLRVLPIGALMFLGGNGFVAIAQLSIMSGGAAVACAMMPLFVGVFAMITGERPSRREWFALLLGFVGILVLMRSPSLAGEPLHIVLIVLAPVCWALGSVLARRLPGAIGRDPFLLPAMEMLTGGLALFVVAMVRGEQFPAEARVESWIALAYLWLFGSLIAFTAYTWLLRNTRPVVATSYAYVNPGIAVLLGAVVSGEPIGATTIVANVLIVAAVWIALRRPRT